MAYTLGILDQSPIIGGLSNEETLQNTVALAQKAEALGYSRFWVSEHHNTEALAGVSPEVLVSYLLAKTKSIKVGSGGVMLQHYSPYKVAENFNLLASLEPGRVDLGIGKAPGGLPLATRALQFGTLNDGSDFEERLVFLNDLVKGSVPEDHVYSGVQATPVPRSAPNLVLLGASPESASLAGRLQIGFVFARFINSSDEVLAKASKAYRDANPGGHFAVAMAVIAAPTAEEAKTLAGDKKIVKLHQVGGRTLTFHTVEQARQFGEEAGTEFTIKEYEAGIIHGTPSEIKGLLDDYSAKFQIDEFILHTPILKAYERERSWELLGPKHLFSSRLKAV